MGAKAPYTGWQLQRGEVLELPIDELALRVLYDVERSGTTDWRRWMGTAKKIHQRDRMVLRALSEAWAWLQRQGFIAWDPEGSSDSIFITRQGREALEHGLVRVDARQLLDIELHPRLEPVRRQFLGGEHELAAFAAMREVEIAVRKLGGFDDSLVGTKLMEQAFRPHGPLSSVLADSGEQVGMLKLFVGAIAVFKNPTSHRQVDYDDPTEAAEVIIFADLLLRIVKRRDFRALRRSRRAAVDAMPPEP